MNESPNLNYIKELTGNDDAFEQKFIGVLIEEFPQEVLAYEDYITTNNFIAAAEMVHKIKHKFSILGMLKAYELAVNYEEELHAESIRLHLDFRMKLKQIETFLKSI